MDLAFSPCEDVIASALWDKVQLWSVRDGALTRTLRGIGASIGAIAFSRAGDRLAGGAFEEVLVWNLQPPRAAPRDDSIGLTGAVKGSGSR